MLAKILEDMWVEPEVLEALSEEQKRILFLKMREEQVRRWREREEREEREGRNSSRTKKAYGKHVTWLLGRDGDVSVSVIGEVDEFRSSKLLQSLMNNRVYSDKTSSVQTEELPPEREAEQLSFKEDIQLALTDVSYDQTSQTAQSSEEESCSADDLKDLSEDSDSESGSSSDNHGDWTPLYRPHFSIHGNQAALKAELSDTETVSQQDREIECYEEKTSDYGGRVAQLRKAFTDDHHNTQPAHRKPPIPTKPAHLQLRGTAPRH